MAARTDLEGLLQGVVAFNVDHATDATPRQLTIQQNPGDAAAVQFSVDAGVTWHDTTAALALQVYPDQAAAITAAQAQVDTAEALILTLKLAGGT